MPHKQGYDARLDESLGAKHPGKRKNPKLRKVK